MIEDMNKGPSKPRPTLAGHDLKCRCDDCIPPDEFIPPPKQMRFLASDDDIETMRVKLLAWRIFAIMLAVAFITCLILVSGAPAQ